MHWDIDKGATYDVEGEHLSSHIVNDCSYN
jgi:hypothetical protein